MDTTMTTLMERVRHGFARVVDMVPVVLEDPAAYPDEAFILAAVAALLLLVIVLIVLIGIDTLSNWSLRKGIGLRRRWDVVALRLAIAALVVMGISGLVSAMPLIPQVGPACGVCHGLEPAVAAWEVDAHAGVSCYSCHARAGLVGAWQATGYGAARRLYSGEESATAAPLFEDRCLKCHEVIGEGVTAGRIRMRHSDVIAAGYSCLSCHPHVGHASMERTPLPVVRSRMSVCLLCHDGVEASSACTTCHDVPPSDTVRTAVGGDTPAPQTCDGCHSPETERGCVDCHGLVLPHPIGFMRQHARLSARDTALCARCHETAGSAGPCDCHSDVNVHGTFNEWFPIHGLAAQTSWPGGCRCHAQSFCLFCHDSIP